MGCFLALSSCFVRLKQVNPARSLSLLLLLCATWLGAQAPDSVWVYQGETRLKRQPTRLSVDRKGFVFLGYVDGDIQKYDPSGTLTQYVFSPDQPSELTLLEAWGTISIVAYRVDYQEAILLDRFLVERSRQRFDPDQVAFGRLATLSSDNGLWVFDDIALALKKVDMNYGELTVNSPLDLVLDPTKLAPTFLREYQNRVYLIDSLQGILVFDNLGNYLRTLPLSGISQVGFQGEWIYYLQAGNLEFLHLYTYDRVTQSLPPSESKWRGISLTSEGTYLLGDKTLKRYGPLLR